MNLGQQRAHTGIRTLPIEEHVKETLFLLRWLIGFEQDGDGSDGWVPILEQIDPFERAFTR